MRRPELELKIRDYIAIIYKAEYRGKFEVIQNGNTYTLQIGLPSYMALTSISYETDDDQEFLDYIFEELRTRNYMRVEFYKVIRTNEKTK